jgi:hypothetical protein
VLGNESGLELRRSSRQEHFGLESDRCSEDLHPEGIQRVAAAKPADLGSQLAKAHEPNLLGKLEHCSKRTVTQLLGQINERAGQDASSVHRSEHGLAKPHIPVAGRRELSTSEWLWQASTKYLTQRLVVDQRDRH